MGNSTALPYDIQEAIDYHGNNAWTLNQGCKQTDSTAGPKQHVTIFRFSKTQRPDRLPLAQRNVQKLRTIRYPFVLTYVDSTETEDSLLLVTEPCVPLEVWFTQVANNPAVPKQNLIYELHWGFKCVLQALEFLHSTCSLLHGNLGLHSIFVTPNGDWKLGAFELAVNVSNADDVSHFLAHHAILDKLYVSPERETLSADKVDSVLKAKQPPYYIDMYSFGQCVQKTFSMLDEELSGSFSKHIATTLNADIKKRPTPKKLLQTSTFKSEYIQILENVQEFSVKAPKEILESIKQLDPLLPQMPVAICSHKVLPSVCRVLQISVNDFQNRDAREACRQAIVVCVELLSKLGELKKLEETIFQHDCVPLLTQLWMMTDRTIRTAMLSALRHLAELVPREAINRSIFDNIIAGFSDSNAKLRESTLMALIYIVDKLDEMHLQDRLVRCVSNLQNDPEASIRTNTTIFLGKIAAKLKESVRVKVLCNALAKAMKDNFVHCRIAGLKTSIACLKFMDPVQLSTKIIPQASTLLLDRSADVRSLSISLIEAGVARMKQQHEEMLELAKHVKETTEESEKRTAGGAEQESAQSSWTAWSGSVLQGFSKTLESVPTKTETAVLNSIALSAETDLSENRKSSLQQETDSSASNKNNFLKDFGASNKDSSSNRGDDYFNDMQSFGGKKAAWDDDDLDGLDEDFSAQVTTKVSALLSAPTSTTNTTNTANTFPVKSNKWAEDDLDDLDLDREESQPSAAVVPPPPVLSSSSFGNATPPSADIPKKSSRSSLSSMTPSSAPSSSDTKTSSVLTSKLKAKPAKVAVKKLEVNKDDKDDWDDF